MEAETESLAAEAVSQLPQRRPASLYDVAVQYSILDWYQTVTSGDLQFDLDPEHLAFMTPMAKSDLYGEPNNVLAVHVDLSGDEPTFRDEKPVRLESVTDDARYKLGHSYPANKTSNMTDYSITTHKEASEYHLSGQREDTWGTNNILDRFTDWAHSDAAHDLIASEDEGDTWILEALQELGDDDVALQELVEHPEFPLDPTNEEREREVFITVRLNLPGSDGYLWPGQVPVLNDVMVAQKAERFENVSVDDAAGKGIGLVSGDEARVTGGSTGLLGMYGKKQREHFPDLDVEGTEAWRSRPITHETAAALATANSVFERFYQALGESRRLYILPYLGAHPDQISPEDFAAFASDVFETLRSAPADEFDGIVGSVFYQRDTDKKTGSLFGDTDSGKAYAHVRAASVFVVTGNPNRVFFEALRTDVFRPRLVDDAHGDVLRTGPFTGRGVFEKIRSRSDSPLLRRDASGRSTMALFGSYFDWTTAPTRSSDEADGTPKAGAIDDIRSRRLGQFLRGERVQTTTLVAEYLHRLVQDQRDLFGTDDEYDFPVFKLLEQYAQLRALDELDALTTTSRQTTQTDKNQINIATVTPNDSDTTHGSRADRLTDFIDSHDVLNGSGPHQAAFLLGGLVGRITAYQRRNNVSSTLVRRYPIDYLTKHSIKEVTNEVIQMNNTYTESDDELPATYNARYTDRLPGPMLSSDPSSWTVSQNELQWVYALGIAYGSNDTQLDTEDTT